MTPSPGYPVTLVGLADRKVLVAGGGPIAARKVEELWLGGARRVHVVALELSPEMDRLREKIARVELRAAAVEDVEGAALVIAATNDVATNRALAEAAARRGILVNAVDDPAACTFYAPAVVRRGPATIAIGTGGGSPLFAGQLRRLLEAALPRSFGAAAELFARARKRGLAGLRGKDRALSLLSDPHIQRLVDRGELDLAERRLDRLLSEDAADPFPPGTVVIAGAGPGSRGLLTVRALDRIHRAEVIVHDALVAPEVLAEALPGTRLVEAGRRCGSGGAAPEMVAELLVREASANRRVLRLHAGDAFVFGRGADEVDALAKAKVPVEIVPGLSAALAAPVAAGIPLTERGVARAITIRTGHTKDGWAESLSVPAAEETLVILMGLGAARELLAGLVAEGRSPETPAAAVSRATLAGQAVVTGTLATLADRIDAAALETPATLIVGEVARRADAARRFLMEVAA